MKILLDTRVWGKAKEKLVQQGHRKTPHPGIIRLVNISATKQADVCNSVINSHQQLLENGAIVTVEGERIRIREAFNAGDV